MSIQMKVGAIAFAAAIASLGSGSARAEEPPMLTDWGMALSVGGGVEDFADDAMQDTTGIGGMWDVRYQLGTRTPLAFEAAYSGSAQTIDAIGLDSDAILLGSVVEGNVRFNAQVGYGVAPYLVAGAAWRRYDLTNVDTNTSDVADSDDVLEIPLGVGIGYRYQSIIADARVTLRIASEQDLLPAEDGEFESMNRWGANARIGYEF